MTFHQRGFEIGPLEFHWYGLIIVTGIIAAASLVAWMAKKDGRDPDHVWNALIWIVVLAVAGARIWHVFFPSISSVEAGRTAEWYLTHPFDLHDGPFILWSGGLSIFGAVLGGALGVYIYARKNHLPILPWMDIAVVSVPLGQAIGRWGNFVNKELYGKPTDLPWGVPIDNPPIEYSQYTHFHPLFLYESLWNAVNCGILLVIWLRYRQHMKRGDFILLYMVLYGLARFALEFLRIEVTEAGGINVSQTVSLVATIVAILILAWRHRGDLNARRRAASASQDGSPSA